MSYGKTCAIAFVGVLSLVAAREASALSLAELLAPDPATGQPRVVVSGDKIFSNWTYLSTTMPAEDIAVNFLPSVGVQFGAGWNTRFTGLMDSVIGYTVSVDPNSGNVISGANLSFAGVDALGGGLATVAETLTDPNSGNVYTLNVRFDGAGPLPDNFSDSVTINPATTSLNVIKDIMVTPVRGVDDSYAAISFVDNTYVQVPGGGETPPVGVIPEPMSLALLPLGLLGLGLRRKLSR